MFINSKGIILSALISTVAVPSYALTDLSDRIEFSGFGRVIGGYLDDKGAKYEDYTNHLSFSQQSLFALQSDLKITETLSLSAQLLAHTSSDRESGLEWLYLNYQPNQNWQFKIGKLRTSFFQYSDVLDVGFAYHWISPPQQVYSGILFSNYEGVSATYRLNVNEINFDIEAYYGVYEGEFKRQDEQVPIDVDEIKGAILNLSKGNLSLRISVTQSADFFADVPAFTQFSDAIEFAGFKENAESLRFNGKAVGYQASVKYDDLDYFFGAEWVKIASDLLVVPEVDSYYLTAGYNFYPFQTHVSYSTSKTAYNTTENLIPKGVNPGLDQLSFAYDQITGNLPLYDLDSISIGFRWDFRHNMAAKADITFLNGEPGESSFFSDISDPDFDRKATLYQIGIEWVF
ncbi:hypothetical protein [Glaciecola sp. MF2-115]|uniref:hypothetical protein n=1 Tax=Glaciecola sp. MF2-115 TaxID=3384827 RepID=UPI0039A0880F